jgi:hypothetical protein
VRKVPLSCRVCVAELARSIIRNTVWACHRPPLGVAIPRAVSSAAIRRADMPASFNSASTGASSRALYDRRVLAAQCHCAPA